MVMIRYTGTNLYSIGGYHKIAKYKFEPNKSVEVDEKDFYSLMKNKHFANRVNSNILSVPREFALEAPKNLLEVKEESSNEEESVSDEKDLSQSVASLKSTLRLIQEAVDAEFLKSVLETDKRDRVKEAVVKRLKEL